MFNRKKHLTESLSSIFFLSMIFIVFLFEVFIIRPYLLENDQSKNSIMIINFHLLMAIILFINTCLNLYLVIITDTSINSIITSNINTNTTALPLSSSSSSSSSLSSQWNYCYICEANIPPRAFHCKQCNRCILRRDHHCVFTSCCIGYKNYKYFMGLLFNVGFGCIYAISIHWPYIWMNIKHLGWWSLGVHSVPLGFYLAGWIDFWTTCCNMISMLCIVGAIFATGLFIYHFHLLCINQTTYEKANLINDYNLNDWRKNLYETLGNRWFLTIFLSPLIKTNLPGDGIKFITNREKYLQNKQI
ncbi:putative palmitoyltransferase ZDHHC24 [Dermatophagoides pteronyssinus]|uniref:putative palmitoyltransferase ZDHHC24 n=1 Tax=Dermatophagoides pteronyssinus TaxID=6956 RepID=UPI003F672052